MEPLGPMVTHVVNLIEFFAICFIILGGILGAFLVPFLGHFSDIVFGGLLARIWLQYRFGTKRDLKNMVFHSEVVRFRVFVFFATAFFCKPLRGVFWMDFGSQNGAKIRSKTSQKTTSEKRP